MKSLWKVFLGMGLVIVAAVAAVYGFGKAPAASALASRLVAAATQTPGDKATAPASPAGVLNPDSGEGICTNDETTCSTTSTTPADNTTIVQATVAPKHYTSVQPLAGGKIAQVLVQVGDTVKAGDPIVVLDNESQTLAVAEAQAALATAQAKLDLAQAGPRPEDISVAEANLANAKAGLAQAVANRNKLTAGVAQAQQASVQAQIDSAKAQRRQLEANAQWAKDGGDMTKHDNLIDQMHVVDAQIAALQARLDALPADAAAQLKAANAGVSAAQTQVAVAQASLDLANAGPTDESIAIAKTAVEQAQADLAAAKVDLDRTTVRAAFDGTITRLDAEVGATAAPGQPVAVLADLSNLHIETTDLTERDVVHVREGQAVTLTFDARPGETYHGHVVSIKDQSLAVDVNGDPTYPVTIALDDTVPGLRWGMSVAVTLTDAGTPLSAN